MSETLKSKNTNEKLRQTLKKYDRDKANKKRKRTKLEKYGDGNYCNKEKIKQTKLEKYGDGNYCNKEKIKQTNLEKYGVTNVFQDKKIKEKIKQTNLEKYGVENPYVFKSDLWNYNLNKKYGDKNYNNKEKIKQTHLAHTKKEIEIANRKRVKTCIKKYGTENPLQNEKIKKKTIDKIKEKYGGVGFQIEDVFNKALENQYKKYQIIVDGKEFNLQGHEPIVLRFLIENENISIEEIECHKNVPTIYYRFNDKKHRHFPDIFIKNENRIIEVKSEYTLYECSDDALEIQKAKMEYGKKMGYVYQVYLYKRNKEMEIINEF
ncbi:MAG: DUF7487 domain-containing protein [bacterium]